MASLDDLANMLAEEQWIEIPVEKLTPVERAHHNVKEGQTHIRVKKVTAKSKQNQAAKSTEEPASQESVAAANSGISMPSAADLESVSDVKLPSAVNDKILEAPMPTKFELPDVPKEEKEEYLRLILALKPYRKTFFLYDNTVQLTFQARTAKQNIVLANFGPALRNQFGLMNKDNADSMFLCFQLLFTMAELKINDISIDIPKDFKMTDIEDVKDKAFDLLSNIPTPIYNMVLAKLIEFEVKLAALEKAVNDINF